MDEVEVKLGIEAVNSLILSIRFIMTASASLLGLCLSFLSFTDHMTINGLSFPWLFAFGWILLSYVLFTAIHGLIHSHNLYMTRLGLHSDPKNYDADILNEPMDKLVKHVKLLNILMILGAGSLSLFIYENVSSANSLIMPIINFLNMHTH